MESHANNIYMKANTILKTLEEPIKLEFLRNLSSLPPHYQSYIIQVVQTILKVYLFLTRLIRFMQMIKKTNY